MMEYKLFTDNSQLLDENLTIRRAEIKKLVYIFIGELRGEMNLNISLENDSMSEVYFITILNGDSELELNYSAMHKGARSKSYFEMRGCLNDNSHKRSTMAITFCEGSCEANGYEKEALYLLSSKAMSISSPSILCHEENISGSHGASYGHLADNELDYLYSRGFNKDEAKKTLIRASIQDILRRIDDEDILKYINKELAI